MLAWPLQMLSLADRHARAITRCQEAPVARPERPFKPQKNRPLWTRTSYWRPAVFFLPDDAGLKPEMAYDGDPLRRGCKFVPVKQGIDMKKARILRDVSRHVGPALDALARFYQRTGQRWEVLYLRERDRSQEAGEAFDWSELPVDPDTLS
jgi:hypothetical protein